MSKELRQNIISAIVAGFLTNAIAFGIFLWVTGGKVATAQDKIERTEARITAVEAKVESQGDLLSRIDERTKSIKEAIERIEHRRNP